MNDWLVYWKSSDGGMEGAEEKQKNNSVGADNQKGEPRLLMCRVLGNWGGVVII